MKKRSLISKGLAVILASCTILSLGGGSVYADDTTIQDASSVMEASPVGTSSDADSAISTEEIAGALGEEVTSDGDVESDLGSESVTVSQNQAEVQTESQPESTPSAVENTEEAAPVGANSQATAKMYRLYNPNSGEHFYTASKAEAANLRRVGWSFEGIGWFAPAHSNQPVYRMYNPNAGDHHYTLSPSERDMLIRVGWNYEGIGWYSDELRRVPLYRQYNPNAKAGSHNFTTSVSENSHLVSVGWRAEGISWYAVSGGMNVAAVSELGAITIYKGVDLSRIYDYNYYISHYADARRLAPDDLAVIKHFYTKGMDENRQAKAGVSAGSAVYQKIKEGRNPLLTIANRYDSKTPYLCIVNRRTHRTYVLQGSKGNWKLLYDWPCGDGKSSTPTPEGVFEIDRKVYMFGEGSHEFWASPFYGNIYFHSVIYSSSATSPEQRYLIIDPTLGAGVSHGCVRLSTDNAKWIYYNCKIGTRVVVTHW